MFHNPPCVFAQPKCIIVSVWVSSMLPIDSYGLSTGAPAFTSILRLRGIRNVLLIMQNSKDKLVAPKTCPRALCINQHLLSIGNSCTMGGGVPTTAESWIMGRGLPVPAKACTLGRGISRPAKPCLGMGRSVPPGDAPSQCMGRPVCRGEQRRSVGRGFCSRQGSGSGAGNRGWGSGVRDGGRQPLPVGASCPISSRSLLT